MSNSSLGWFDPVRSRLTNYNGVRVGEASVPGPNDLHDNSDNNTALSAEQTWHVEGDTLLSQSDEDNLDRHEDDITSKPIILDSQNDSEDEVVETNSDLSDDDEYLFDPRNTRVNISQTESILDQLLIAGGSDGENGESRNDPLNGFKGLDGAHLQNL